MLLNRVGIYLAIFVGFFSAKVIFTTPEHSIQALLMMLAFITVEGVVYLYDEFGKIK